MSILELNPCSSQYSTYRVLWSYSIIMNLVLQSHRDGILITTLHMHAQGRVKQSVLSVCLSAQKSPDTEI